MNILYTPRKLLGNCAAAESSLRSVPLMETPAIGDVTVSIEPARGGPVLIKYHATKMTLTQLSSKKVGI